MSQHDTEHEHEQESKTHQPHAEHEDHSPASKGPHDTSQNPEINPKLSSDIAYWAKEFGVTGQALHEAIRVHGTHVAKICTALSHQKTS